MLSPARNNFIKDGEVLPNEAFDQALFKGRNTVYEVMRLMKGQAVFLDEHLDRLMSSLEKSRITAHIDRSRIVHCINKLIEANTPDDGNILFCLIRAREQLHVMTWFVEHHYPSAEDYRDGVRIVSYKAMRTNPTAKVWNASLRKKTASLKELEHVFEVLLVDDRNYVTECSKSNIFFIREERIFTPPEHLILHGITRHKIFGLCKDMDIEIEETDVPYREMSMFASAFITGTSPKVLPVRQIDDLRFNAANPLLRSVMQAFDALIMEELK